MARSRVKRASRTSRTGGISPALAAFLSAAASSILTVVGTLVSLRNDATKQQLFEFLTWVLYVAAFAAAAITLWMLADAVRTNVRELHHLRGLEAYVPQLIRFRRRADRFEVSERGDAELRIECDVELKTDTTMPWITIPMLSEVSADGKLWSSIKMKRVCVDGVEYDPSIAFLPRERRLFVGERHLEGRVVESGVIRVPVSLEPGHSRSSFVVELELLGAFEYIMKEEMCYTDVSYVTEELSVEVLGKDGMVINCSPYSDHRVQAMQLGMELIDIPESQHQSASCRMGSGVHWRSETAKLGYRYRVPVRGQRVSSSLRSQ